MLYQAVLWYKQLIADARTGARREEKMKKIILLLILIILLFGGEKKGDISAEE